MEEFLKLYNDLQGMSQFNPLYKIKRDYCIDKLEEIKTQEDVPFEDYRKFMNSLEHKSSKETFQSTEIFLECLDSETQQPLDSFLHERDMLKEFYVHYKKDKMTRQPKTFKEQFQELMEKLKSYKDNYDEGFWLYFHLLRVSIGFTKYDSANFKIIRSYVKDIIASYSFYCEKKAELLDGFKNEKMKYFGSVSDNYNNLDLAEAFFVKEYLVKYANDYLFNYFFEIANSIFDPENINVNDFLQLEKTRMFIVSDKNFRDTINIINQLKLEGLSNFLWVVDNEYLEETINRVIDIFDKATDYDVFQRFINQWLLNLSSAVLALRTLEEINSDFNRFIQELELHEIEVIDKDDLRTIIKNKWKEVHQE